MLRWAPSIEAGLADAKAKGLPLMVALNMDRERGNDAMVKSVYTDPAVLAAAGKCICTVACMDAHDPVKDPATGRMVCSKFGSLTCAEHQAVEKIVRIQWLKKKASDDVDSPQHFFLAPDGRRLFHRTWTLEAKELAALMARAGALCAPATLAAWDTLEGRLLRAADPLGPVRAEAIEALAGMKDPAVDGKLADMAKGSPEEGVQCDVLDAFAPAMNPARVALAASLLSAKGPLARMHAAVALEASKTPEALKALSAALGAEKEGQVRAVLYRALAGCSPADPGAKTLVLGGLKEKNPDVLPSVLVALAPWAEDPQVVAPLKAIAFGRDPWMVRAAACWTLGLSGHRELVPALQDIKDDSRGKRLTSVVQLAVRRLGGMVDAAEYRGAVKGFAWSLVRHPDDPKE
jgi:HEAT repeat protein